VEEMKKWIFLTCVVCGFGFAPRRFIREPLEPILFPAQTVTDGGRAKRFRVERYTPWSEVAYLKEQPEVWRALNCECVRLSFAYDAFYEHLHFLSPRMLESMGFLNNENFRLRTLCKELRDPLDRLLVMRPHGVETDGKFGRILEEVNRRDREERRSALELIK
jgi:hypothetical protein